MLKITQEQFDILSNADIFSAEQLDKLADFITVPTIPVPAFDAYSMSHIGLRSLLNENELEDIDELGDAFIYGAPQPGEPNAVFIPVVFKNLTQAQKFAAAYFNFDEWVTSCYTKEKKPIIGIEEFLKTEFPKYHEVLKKLANH